MMLLLLLLALVVLIGLQIELNLAVRAQTRALQELGQRSVADQRQTRLRALLSTPRGQELVRERLAARGVKL